MSPLTAAGTLLIHVIFDTYLIILLLRLLLQKLGASWHNPISQFIIQLTEIPLRPLKKIIPRFHGFDLSILLLALVLQFIAINLLWILQLGSLPNALGSLIISIGELLSKGIYIYMYAIIINAVASWVPQLQSHPVAHIVYVITEPLLSQFRRWIPLIAGIDISSIFALLLLTLINMLVVGSLLTIGTQLILGSAR